MEDGAKSLRFSPIDGNSGFFYIKYNHKTLFMQEELMKAVNELMYTHSHQMTLTRYINEANSVFGLLYYILDIRQFPSGYMYHHNKTYLSELMDNKYVPYVFHMCWTASRKDKVIYFKKLGYWYLKESPNCNNPKVIIDRFNKTKVAKNFLYNCCNIK